MTRDYVIIWQDELASDKHFEEYCQMKNAVQVNDELEPDEEGTGCKFFTIPKRNKIIIDITEGDIEEFKQVAFGDNIFNWQFNTQNGVPIDVHFIAEVNEDVQNTIHNY